MRASLEISTAVRPIRFEYNRLRCDKLIQHMYVHLDEFNLNIMNSKI